MVAEGSWRGIGQGARQGETAACAATHLVVHVALDLDELPLAEDLDLVVDDALDAALRQLEDVGALAPRLRVVGDDAHLDAVLMPLDECLRDLVVGGRTSLDTLSKHDSSTGGRPHKVANTENACM